MRRPGLEAPEHLELQGGPGGDIARRRGLNRVAGQRRGGKAHRHHAGPYLPAGGQLHFFAEIATLQGRQRRVRPQVVVVVGAVVVRDPASGSVSLPARSRFFFIG